MLILRIAVAVVALGLVVAAHLYLYRRLVHEVTDHLWARLAAGALLLAVTLAAVLARTLWRGSTGAWSLAFGLPLWFGFFLYALMALLAIEAGVWLWSRQADTRAAPPSPERRKFVARAAAVGAASFGGGLAGFGVFRAYAPPEATTVQLRLPGLPRTLEGFTLVQLTDVHLGSVLQQPFIDDLVARTNALGGDLVAITGDLVDGTPAQLGRYVARLSNLAARHGTYFVTGNHDYYSGADAWVQALEGLGVNVLRNRRVVIGSGADSFDLLGVDDWGGLGFGNGYDLEAATRGRDPARASVLLAHQPTNFDAVAAQGIGLQISGHTHGGQLFPGNLVASLLWQGRSQGLTRVGASQLYVSRGCGFVGPPMRVGSAPEIVKYVLLPA